MRLNCFLVYVFFAACLLQCTVFAIPATPPRVSVITSVYDGDLFIDRFLKNIIQQTIFSECELILINANSPGNEEQFILPYLKQYPNIKYIKLNYDPGVYGVWNLGIFVSEAPYVTNANLDDLRYPDCLEKHADYLDTHQEIALVYSDYIVSDDPVGGIETCHIYATVNHPEIESTKKGMMYCLPGPQPMWRKRVHFEVGFFDQGFLYSGDWEMWNRMAKAGFEFARISNPGGIYYFNPNGLSTNQVPEKVARRNAENQYIINTYTSMWNGQE